MSTTEVTLKILLSSLFAYGLISKVQCYITFLWCSENILIWLNPPSICSLLSLLCHFSECAFAAIEMEGKKARLRRTYRHHPIHDAAQFESAIHGPFLTGMLQPHLHEVHLLLFPRLQAERGQKCGYSSVQAPQWDFTVQVASSW